MTLRQTPYGKTIPVQMFCSRVWYGKYQGYTLELEGLTHNVWKAIIFDERTQEIVSQRTGKGKLAMNAWAVKFIDSSLGS